MPRLAGASRSAIGPGRIRRAFLVQRQRFLREGRISPTGLTMSKMLIIATLIPPETGPARHARLPSLNGRSSCEYRRYEVGAEEFRFQHLKDLLMNARVWLINLLRAA